MFTILEIARADINLTKMMAAIRAAGLEESLGEIGPFTILAPVNLAFNPETMEELLKPGNKEKLSDMLSYHFLAGKKMLRDFTNGHKLKTIHDKDVSVMVKDGEIFINGSKILSRDRQASNGVVHTVNALQQHQVAAV
jgi:uncharacterized surface protein with fasciclin (FAS1) repeats